MDMTYTEVQVVEYDGQLFRTQEAADQYRIKKDLTALIGKYSSTFDLIMLLANSQELRDSVVGILSVQNEEDTTPEATAETVAEEQEGTIEEPVE